MAVQEGPCERLRVTGCADEVAYIQPCLRLLFASAAGAAAGETQMPSISLADVIAPWLSSLKRPQRRTVLWELCGRGPVRHLAEAGRAASVDLSRRIFERPAFANGTVGEDGER